MSTLKVNAIVDASGGNTATINTYSPPAPVRAWVNFNGTGTVAITAQYNVSSITDNGTGNYTVNFTTAITDANYAAVGTCEQASGGGQVTVSKEYATAPTTTAFALICRTGSNAASDPRFVYVAIFR